MTQDNTPPKAIPAALLDAYTMGGRIPVGERYFDSRREGEPLRITMAEYEETFEQLETKTFLYYGEEAFAFYPALEKYPVSGKRVLIWGLVECNCDAMAVWKGAEHVWAVDYNSVTSEHPKVTGIDHAELARLPFSFDCAFSYSSFEHDGLGRYGDPLNPDGDLAAMRSAWEYLKPGGILFLGIPLGGDALIWNAHRIYGPARLPLMLRGFSLLDVFSVYPELYLDEYRPGEHRQALLVLQKRMPGEDGTRMLYERMRYASLLARGQGDSFMSGTALQNILEMQLRSPDVRPNAGFDE